MERRNHVVSSLSVQLSIACIFATAAFWFSQSGRTGLFPLALIPYAPALYGLDRLFLRRERSMRGLVLFNIFLGLAFFALLAADIGWGQWKTLAMGAVFCLWLTGQGCGLALEPPPLSRVILCLDGSLVMLLLSVAYGAAVQAPARQLIPACVGFAGSLLGLMVRRLGGGAGARGWTFVAGAFVVIAALVFLLVEFAAAPAGQGLVALWNALTAAARAAGALAWKFAQWLVSLLPLPEGEGEITMEPPQGAMPEVEQAPQADSALLVVLAALLGVGLICLALWVLRRLGRRSVGGKHAAAAAAAPRRKGISLGDGLRRLLASWAAYLRMRLWLVQNRNTPRGLYYLLVRRCRVGSWHKRPGETPREFLLRLREKAGGDPELSAALEELIPAVDTALFAPPGRPCPPVRGRLIRRRLGAAVGRGFLRERPRLPRRRPDTAEKI